MDKKILNRYVEGQASAAETEAVMAWMEADDENVRELNALHRLYDISLFGNAEAAAEPLRPRRPLVRIAAKVAAVAAAFLIAWLCLDLCFGDKASGATKEWQSLFVPAGQRAELSLSDGTKVWLNSQGRLEYPSGFDGKMREVRLEGEAYFKVSRDGERPFVVKTSGGEIEVKGTEFNVVADSVRGIFAVSLLSGSISLKPAGHEQGYLMKVNEHAEWNGDRLLVSRIHDFNYFRWKEGLLCFTNETVGSIIGKLQAYYDISIEVKRPSLLEHRYSGKFRSRDGVEQVLKVLQLEHKFVYTRDNELNVITIK
ncbi:MAG: FecR domain-containing protein [Tannerellaceae bacterium]|nr:FecR domain-containing protein [Tannerellaceae bacterium]